jgi:hypothetical protein
MKIKEDLIIKEKVMLRHIKYKKRIIKDSARLEND